MKKILLFAALAFAICINTYSQTNNFTQSTSTSNKINRILVSPVYDGSNKLDIKDIKGSPYLNPAFDVGSISTIKEKVLIRYNAYNDLFEVKQNTDSILNLNKSNTNYTVQVNNYTFKSFVYPANNSDQYTYFALLTKQDSSNVVLLKTMRKNLNKAQKAVNSYSQGKQASFSNSPVETYYILNSKKEILEFKPKTKTLYSLFPKLKTKLKSYIKDNNSNIKEETDLIKIIDYLNTLS